MIKGASVERSAERPVATIELGDADVQNLIHLAREQRLQGLRSAGGFDDLKPIDPAEVLGLEDDPGTTES